MAKKLTREKYQSKTQPLTNQKANLFQISISPSLEKKYNFSKLNNNKGNQEFQRFLNDTIMKRLTIVEVENQFLRTKGKPSSSEKIDGAVRDIFHFGKDRKALRVFGYYDENGYFLITALDTNHKKQKE